MQKTVWTDCGTITQNKVIPVRAGRTIPSYAYQLEFQKRLKKLIKEMVADTQKSIRREFDTIVTDSNATVMKELRQRWYKRFEKEGRSATRWLAQKANDRTDRQITKKLSLFGWVRPKTYTEVHKQTINALAAESVSFIKSIPQRYLRNVQRTVAESVERGGDRQMLKEYLEDLYEKLLACAEKADNYAELVARDQSNKMTQGYAIVNAQSYGARYGRWVHVQGMKSSRTTHEEMDGKLFDLSEGLYDEDYGDYVKPAELMYCQCQFEVIFPEFESIEVKDDEYSRDDEEPAV